MSQTEAMIKGFTCLNSKGTYSGLDASKIAVCLPASSAAASSGYASTTIVKSALDYLRGTGSKPGTYTLKTTGGYPALAGMGTWSINTDLDASYSYANNFATIFTTCLTTSVAENENNNKLKLYPNPTDNNVTINTENSMGEFLKIYDVSGQTLYNQPITNSTMNINVSSFSEGLYFVQINSTSLKLLIDK